VGLLRYAGEACGVARKLLIIIMIYLGSDHAGYKLKEALEIYLKELGYDVSDNGTENPNLEDDYPDFITPVACKVSENSLENRGIILGGSGEGEAMMANRFKNVRAGVYYGGPLDIIKLSREHNDSNILSLGARFMTEEEAKKAVKMWLETPFPEEERHQRRIQKIEELSDSC